MEQCAHGDTISLITGPLIDKGVTHNENSPYPSNKKLSSHWGTTYI